MTTRTDGPAGREPGGLEARDHRRVFAEFARALAGALARSTEAPR